ncbi:MAG: hypothetical protein EBV03_12185 [Proteobacteria bacterium]|nr:hypothetical protein [Pseudomonadota bacterium]
MTSVEIEKSNERIFLPGQPDPVELVDGSELTRFMQRVRDEAHRFVITFHRKSRSKRIIRSTLDEVGGLGAERRGRLLRHFGSIKNIAAASAEEVAKAGRMPKSLAERVLQQLAHEQQRSEQE